MPSKNAKTRTKTPPAHAATHVSPTPPTVDPLHPPVTREALWRWVRDVLGVEVARTPLLVGHAAPMDYLWHAFDEGRDEAARGIAPPASDCVVWANRGGGKTFMGALATALDMVFKPGIEIRLLAGSMDQGRRMHAHLRRFFHAPLLAELIDGKATDKRIRLTNGSEVELLAQSQASVRGTRVQKLRCDEVELFDLGVWEAAQLTTRSRPCGVFHVRGSVECLSTAHIPFGVMHTLLAEAATGRRRMFKWGVLDVLGPCEPMRECETPREDGTTLRCGLWDECQGRAKQREGNDVGIVGGHLRIDDALRMKGRVAVNTWKTEMLCERPRRGDCVIEEFDPAEHVFDDCAAFDPIASGAMWIGGMDFGFRAPTVVLWACVDALGVVRVMHERRVTQRTVQEHADAIVNGDRPRLEWIGIDPAGNSKNDQTGETSRQVLSRAGLNVRCRMLKVREGLDLIRARLKPASGDPARLLVHQRCSTLIKSLETYHYDLENPESNTPVKDGSDHAVDALRYMIVNLDKPGRNEIRAYAV